MSAPVNVCRSCHRPLTDPASRERGLGPVCAHKNMLALARESGEVPLERPLREPFAGETVRLFWLPDGTVGMNLPRAVIQHSPTGWQVGYGGSGPADLALNILAAFFPVGCDGEPPVKCWQGQCSATAWRLHQDFKRAFVAGWEVPKGSTLEVPAARIVAWAEQTLAEREGQAHARAD